MKTVITTDAVEAAEFIKNGGIVAFPTETVYGLGANVFNVEAVRRVFAAKRRPADNPLIVHIADLPQLGELASEITAAAQEFIDGFFPGPLTVVVKKTGRVPLIATAGLETVGVRMPRSPLAHNFLTAAGVPVAAPSANLSGRPSPTSWQAVHEDLDGSIDCILKGEPTEIGLESTVVDCTSESPILLRSGSITLEQLRAVVPQTDVYGPRGDSRVRSPGMNHRHYSPAAVVVLVDHPPPQPKVESAYIGIEETGSPFVLRKVCNSVDEYARGFFEFFRECDRRGVATIYCQIVPELGIGSALMDRLRRAAQG